MDQSNQKQKASNGDFLSILSDMHADLYEEAHLTRAEMRSQIEHFARQTFRPPVSSMMGSTCTVRVLAFWNLLSEAFETLRNGWGEPSSPFYNGCPYWKLGTVRKCKLCCDGGHCPRHIDCDHCTQVIWERLPAEDQGIALVLTNKDRSKMSISWLPNENHAQEHIKYLSNISRLSTSDKPYQMCGIRKLDGSVHVAYKIKVKNLSMIRNILQLEWEADLSRHMCKLRSP